MVPSTDWTKAAQGFAQSQGRQVLLCVTCVTHLGDTTPPDQVLVYGGYTTCLEHLPLYQRTS